MDFEFDGNKVDIKAVYYREKKFGTDAPEYTILPYRLEIPYKEFVDAFDELYNDYAEDDIKFGMEADEIDLQLREINWPPLEQLISEFPNICETFLTESAYSLALQELFADAGPEPSQYLINSVSSVKIEKNNIVFSGDAIDLGNTTDE